MASAARPGNGCSARVSSPRRAAENVYCPRGAPLGMIDGLFAMRAGACCPNISSAPWRCVSSEASSVPKRASHACGTRRAAIAKRSESSPLGLRSLRRRNGGSSGCYPRGSMQPARPNFGVPVEAASNRCPQVWLLRAGWHYSLCLAELRFSIATQRRLVRGTCVCKQHHGRPQRS